MKIHEGRLSAVIGDNKVLVYDFEKLLSGATRNTATILIHDEDTAPIHHHFLRYTLIARLMPLIKVLFCLQVFFFRYNFLLLVHGVSVTLYNFWKYTPTSEVKDFIL